MHCLVKEAAYNGHSCNRTPQDNVHELGGRTMYSHVATKLEMTQLPRPGTVARNGTEVLIRTVAYKDGLGKQTRFRHVPDTEDTAVVWRSGSSRTAADGLGSRRLEVLPGCTPAYIERSHLGFFSY